MPTSDRSHPQLRALDALVASGLTYAGWQGDVKSAERFHVMESSTCDAVLASIKAKQTIHTSDRSHPQLCALDALVASGLTYAGWQEDVEDAEHFHVTSPSTCDSVLAEIKAKQTIHTSDRSHPQLRALDALVASGLTYAGWQEDVERAELCHVTSPSTCDYVLAEIKAKQTIHTGDRSHPQLRALDALVASGLTYAGWQEDVESAERFHVTCTSTCDSVLARIKAKQTIHTSDRSHPQLCALDALVASGLTYAGWQEDVESAERFHVTCTSTCDYVLAEIKAKQTIHTSDRSHPQLRALDVLVASGLTYAGWQEDVKRAEYHHVTSPSTCNYVLAEIKAKQTIHTSDRSHPQLRALDALVASGLTYAGWQEDVESAERFHVTCTSTCDSVLARIKAKQTIHTSDRSHPQLCALDALVASGLTYAGWQEDVESAERFHVTCTSTCDYVLAEIKAKQTIHTSDRSHPQLRALDVLVASGLTYAGWQEDVKRAEYHHVTSPSTCNYVLAEIKAKQTIHTSDRSHPQLRALDALVASGLTYAGWQGDVQDAEHFHVTSPSTCNYVLARIKAKQAFHTGDRSHPQLCALDALVASGLTYAGWQEDVKKAEHYHRMMYSSLFHVFLAEMGRKERSQLGIVPPPQNEGKQLAAAMLSNPAQTEAGPALQQAPSPAQTGDGKVGQPGRKRIADSADPTDGEEEGRQRESKKARKAGASGGAETGGGQGSEGGLTASGGDGWQAEICKIQERYRELEAKEARREKREARLEERVTKLEEKVVISNSLFKQAQEELARLRPEQVDLTGEDDEDKKLGQGANGGQEGAGRGGSGAGWRETSGMALLAQAQQRTLQVKRERDDAEEERHEEGTYSALFINGLQTQIDALRGCAPLAASPPPMSMPPSLPYRSRSEDAAQQATERESEAPERGEGTGLGGDSVPGKGGRGLGGEGTRRGGEGKEDSEGRRIATEGVKEGGEEGRSSLQQLRLLSNS